MTDLLHSRAANFIGFFEHFSAATYWDVNAWRLGFGSDTEGPDQVKVVKGMTTTRPRALQNLLLRIPEFEAEIIRQVSQSVWDHYTASFPNVCLALLSFVYNYGELTPSLASCVIHGVGISDAIQARMTDNAGENSKRRFAEAAMVASEGF